MMKTIDIDFDKKHELEALSSAIKKAKIKLGKDLFHIRLFVNHSTSDTAYAAYLLLLVKYFSYETSLHSNKMNINPPEFERHIGQLIIRYFNNYDVNKLENEIEKEFKVDIELERKNPTDDVFGIWKNENISLEKIREKAWQRAK